MITFAVQDPFVELGKVLAMSPEETAQAKSKAEAHVTNVMAASRRRPRADRAEGTASSTPVIWVIWAEADLERLSPSLLLGYALLTSRRENALFLRMATGFGFAQVCCSSVTCAPMPPKKEVGTNILLRTSCLKLSCQHADMLLVPGAGLSSGGAGLLEK
jgi:hypothetical protein